MALVLCLSAQVVFVLHIADIKFQTASVLFAPQDQTSTVLSSFFKQYSISTNNILCFSISSMSKLKFRIF